MQSQRSQNNGNGRWTSQEHELFLEGLRIYGRDWKRIEQLVVSRSGAQIRSHAQKFFLKLKKFNEEGDNSLNTPEVTDTLEAPSSFSKIQGESIRIPKLSVALESTSFFMTFIANYTHDLSRLDFWPAPVDTKTEGSSQETLCGEMEVEERMTAFKPYVVRREGSLTPRVWA